ncbi:MAG: BlaI/MecI/CopY family transcriptional regulator [Firmicutes bacterium]|nr:BlaI/MecI/CopY family transcriptional regulator [Bacillota bacterium]
MDDIRISDSEWAVMKVLWHKGADGMTMKEIDEAVREHGWSYTTVRTMVGRLTEKGALRADRSHKGSFTYFPAVSEERCRRAEVKGLMDRLFDGSAELMFSSLVKDKGLTEEEERTLLEIIEKME